MNLKALRESIPAHCFQSDALTSLKYMVFDLALFSTSMLVYPWLIAGNGILAHFMYWNIYGFIGWCIFVIGHDCGHGSFSKSAVLNAVCGHVCHGALLVPFYPWARSHHMHHANHNHKEKDRSHPWPTDEEFSNFNLIMQTFLPTLIGPFFGFWAYLFIGLNPDGSHIIWFGRLYEGASWIQKLGCAISSAYVAGWICIMYHLTGSFINFWCMYGGIIVFTYFWLFMVTWFQHHDENTLVYKDEDWTFLKSAVQTVDRKLGYGLDAVHHNVSNCHVIHHLFFTSIPHYHLRKANDALQAYAVANNFKLKFVDHSLYPLKYVVDFLLMYPKFHMTKWSYGS